MTSGALGVAADEVVHHPPGDLAVRAGPLGRVDVDAAEDRGFPLVEEGPSGDGFQVSVALV